MVCLYGKLTITFRKIAICINQYMLRLYSLENFQLRDNTVGILTAYKKCTNQNDITDLIYVDNALFL